MLSRVLWDITAAVTVKVSSLSVNRSRWNRSNVFAASEVLLQYVNVSRETDNQMK